MWDERSTARECRLRAHKRFAGPPFLYPAKCSLADENPVGSMLLIFLSHSGVAMETGLSHPPLIKPSLGSGGRTQKNEQVEQYSPQMLP